jgi:hypothetical protein
MIAIAALALGLTIGGADYDEAFARAKHYENDAKVRLFVDGTFAPKINPQLAKALGDCRKTLHLKPGVYEFTVVISYRDGKPNRILLDKDTPVGRCAAEGLAAAAYPDNPPYADLAEDLEVTADMREKPAPAPTGATGAYD